MRGTRLCVCLLGAAFAGVASADVSWVIWADNGHAYAVGLAPGGITWTDARASAIGCGAELVSITSAEENGFVFSLVDDPALFIAEMGTSARLGPWIGLWKPLSTWEWTNGEPVGYTAWAPGEPNGLGASEFRGHFFSTGGGPSASWNDFPDTGSLFPGNERPVAFVMERAGCPGDVDGDHRADFEDLNILLGSWDADVAPWTSGDLNGDGRVDFDDLNALLAEWGRVCEVVD